MVNISNRYNTYAWGGSKHLLLRTRNGLAGANPSRFLPILLLAMAGLFGCLSVLLLWLGTMRNRGA